MNKSGNVFAVCFVSAVLFFLFYINFRFITGAGVFQYRRIEVGQAWTQTVSFRDPFTPEEVVTGRITEIKKDWVKVENRYSYYNADYVRIETMPMKELRRRYKLKEE